MNNIKLIGNLKFSQKKIRNDKIPLQLKNFFNRKTHWCASSTHRGEEEFCIDAHCNLKKIQKSSKHNYTLGTLIEEMKLLILLNQKILNSFVTVQIK